MKRVGLQLSIDLDETTEERGDMEERGTNHIVLNVVQKGAIALGTTETEKIPLAEGTHFVIDQGMQGDAAQESAYGVIAARKAFYTYTGHKLFLKFLITEYRGPERKRFVATSNASKRSMFAAFVLTRSNHEQYSSLCVQKSNPQLYL